MAAISKKPELNHLAISQRKLFLLNYAISIADGVIFMKPPLLLNLVVSRNDSDL